LVSVLSVKLLSVPVGQNIELRVPFGVCITTKRVGDAVAAPAVRRASSSGTRAVAAREPRSKFLRVNLRGFMGYLF
jgi:hypothetical protein